MKYFFLGVLIVLCLYVLGYIAAGIVGLVVTLLYSAVTGSLTY